MPTIENPIINSPFAEPQQHHELDDRGNPTGNIIPQRRKGTNLTPIPQPRKKSGATLPLFDDILKRPEDGRIAVKVINHYGDEVLKVYSV